MAKTLFVIGTGTDVGKTYVTGLIVKKLREHGRKVAYFKAAMSGNERDTQGNLIPGSELYFCETFWPDFREEEFCKAIYDYQKRERRFGKTSEQI